MKPANVIMSLRAVIFILIGILIVLGIKIAHITRPGNVHNHFVVVGDYTFEALGNPNEYGEIDVLVKNIKGECFDYKQAFNDVDAIKRFTYRDMNTMISPSEYEAEWKISIHVKSGLVLYPYSKNELSIHDAANKAKVFESASNFFDIY
ncbi:MAG: hypothetical protein WCJ45_04180 [bacterium]